MKNGDFILVAGLLCCGSCKNQGSHTPPAPLSRDTIVVSDAAIRYSSYTGILPCKGCSGIQTTINLMEDHSYQKISVYLGKNGRKRGEPEDETGEWELRGKDTVYLKESKNAPDLYLKSDSFLIQLNENGLPIPGEKLRSYRLQKTRK